MALVVDGYLSLYIVYRILCGGGGIVLWNLREVRDIVGCGMYRLAWGSFCGCGLCVVETALCGLVYVQCHSIICCCRGDIYRLCRYGTAVREIT